MSSLSLDADFLSGLWHPGFLKLAADYAQRRTLEPDVAMNRLYVVESTPTTTGFKAEHRLRLRASADGSDLRQHSQRRWAQVQHRQAIAGHRRRQPI